MNKPFIVTAGERVRLHAQVLNSLGKGKQNAVRGKDLAIKFRLMDDRKIRVIIDALIEEGVKIAASVSEPTGYFIVNTPEEAAEYIRVLESRSREINKRLSNFKRACADMTLPVQASF